MNRAERLRHESDPNKIKAEISDRKRGLLFMAAIMLVGVCFADPIPVEYNPEGSPIPVSEMEEAIEYAQWAWSSRIEVPDTEYVGLTGATEEDGKIIVQWEDLTTVSKAMLTQAEEGYTTEVADLADSFGDIRLAYATWTYRNYDRSLVRAVIVLNNHKGAGNAGKCLYETISHELAHIFRLATGHSSRSEDVMYPLRGPCRYSPSLSDIAFMGKPLKSCHVELTPHGALEYLDYNGKRILLNPVGENQWELANGYIYDNPSPQDCDGVYVDGETKEVWAEVKSFNSAPTFLRLRPENGLYRSIPFNN